MKLRSLTIGLALLATGTIIGVAILQFASAGISSGDRSRTAGAVVESRILSIGTMTRDILRT